MYVSKVGSSPKFEMLSNLDDYQQEISRMAVQGNSKMLIARLFNNDARQTWVDAYAECNNSVIRQMRSLIGMSGDQPMPKVTPELTKDEGGRRLLSGAKLIINPLWIKVVPALMALGSG